MNEKHENRFHMAKKIILYILIIVFILISVLGALVLGEIIPSGGSPMIFVLMIGYGTILAAVFGIVD